VEIQSVVEVFEFNLVVGTPESKFLEAARDFVTTVRNSGRAHTSLLKGTEERWALLTTYSSEDDAQQFFPKLMALPHVKKWLQMIDRSSIRDSKYKLMS
jgi:hypothetical protein